MRTLGRKAVLAMAIFTAATVAIAIAAPARAAEAGETDDTVSALGGLNLLASDGSVKGDLAVDTGVVVGSGATSVGLKPDTDAPGSLASGGAAVVYSDESGNFAYAVTGEGSAANAGYVVIDSEDAPAEYRFRITADAEPAILESAADGMVLVKDARGTLLNAIHAPWAIAADGKPVATSYTLEGDVVVQHVDHAGAVYPVVADPRLACDLLWCTLELTRTETSIVAQGGGGAIACGAAGPAAPICVALLVGGAAMASIALANKKCIGVRTARAGLPTTTHLVYVGCYA